MNDIIYVTDPKGCFVYVNPVVKRITGFAENEVVGRHFLDFVRRDYHDRLNQSLVDQYKRKILFTEQEFPIIGKNGDEIWISQNVQLIQDDGTVVGFQAIARDVTEHKRMVSELRESEEKFRALAENSIDTIMRFDHQLRHLYVNPIVEEQTGIPAHGFIGKTHRELGFPDDLCQLWDKAISQCLFFSS